MSRTIQITFDCADPNALAGFWNGALGYQYQPAPEGFATWDEALDAFGVPEGERNNASASLDPEEVGPRLFFQKVPEGKRSQATRSDGSVELMSVKNKVHLDVRAAQGLEGDDRMAALESEAERLVTLGATRVERHDPDPPLSGGHIVMEDPEGNVFCLD